jgi:hypothetical protein
VYGNVGIFGEGGEAQKELNHSERVDVVYKTPDDVQLLDAADALHG